MMKFTTALIIALQAARSIFQTLRALEGMRAGDVINLTYDVKINLE